MTAFISNSEADRIGEAIRSGPITANLLVDLEGYRALFLPAYEEVVNGLRKTLKAQVTGRPSKSTSAIFEKLNRESVRMSQIQDIAGCRVLVDGVSAQETALLRIRNSFGAVRIVDRRERPSHGYRAIHIVVRRHDRNVEIQLRTKLQHMWAEISEKMSDVIDPGLKYGKGDDQSLRLLIMLSEAIAAAEDAEKSRDQLRLLLPRNGSELGKDIKQKLKRFEREFKDNRERLVNLLKAAERRFKLEGLE